MPSNSTLWSQVAAAGASRGAALAADVAEHAVDDFWLGLARAAPRAVAHGGGAPSPVLAVGRGVLSLETARPLAVSFLSICPF